MAGQYDGTIIIDTAIKTNGVDKGTRDIQQKLKSGAKKTAVTVEKIGRTLQEGVSKSLSIGQQETGGFSGATKEARELQAQIEKLHQLWNWPRRQRNNFWKQADHRIPVTFRIWTTGYSI